MLLTLLAEGGDSNVCRIDGASPLWIASQMGHDHIVRVLLKSGAHVDAVRCVSSCKITKIDFLLFKFMNEMALNSFISIISIQDGATPLFKAGKL